MLQLYQLLKHFGGFGAPYQLRSDNGPHFIADLIREFLLHCLSLAYSKEENAIVERYNKEISRHLRALTYDNSRIKKNMLITSVTLTDYKKSLPFVQRILNSNHSDRLKISAPQMLFGNMLNLDRGIFLPLEERPVSIRPLSLYASEMLAMQKNLLKNLLQNYYALIYYICQLKSLILTKIFCLSAL